MCQGFLSFFRMFASFCIVQISHQQHKAFTYRYTYQCIEISEKKVLRHTKETDGFDLAVNVSQMLFNPYPANHNNCRGVQQCS